MFPSRTASVVFSSATRAAALREDLGIGAKLILDENGMLPRNTLGLPNDNDGPFPDEQMYLAGDVRANENVLLTSLQTIFAREHNRLVDRIAERIGKEASTEGLPAPKPTRDDAVLPASPWASVGFDAQDLMIFMFFGVPIAGLPAPAASWTHGPGGFVTRVHVVTAPGSCRPG